MYFLIDGDGKLIAGDGTDKPVRALAKFYPDGQVYNTTGLRKVATSFVLTAIESVDSTAGSPGGKELNKRDAIGVLEMVAQTLPPATEQLQGKEQGSEGKDNPTTNEENEVKTKSTKKTKSTGTKKVPAKVKRTKLIAVENGRPKMRDGSTVAKAYDIWVRRMKEQPDPHNLERGVAKKIADEINKACGIVSGGPYMWRFEQRYGIPKK